MLLPKQPTPPSSDWPMLHFYATTKTANTSFLWLTNASLLCYYQNSQRLLPLTDQCFTSMLLPKQPTPPSSDWPMLHFYATTKTANASFLWLTNASLLCYYQNSQRLLPLTDQCFTSMLLPKQPTPPSSDWPMLHFYATTKTANASFLWLTNASLLCYYQNSQHLLPLTDQCFTSMLLPKQPTPPSSDWPMLHFYATTKTANASFLWLTNASLLCYYQNSQHLLPLTDECFTYMLLPKQPTPPSSDWPMLHFYATTKTANASFLWLTNASLLCYYQNSQRLLPLTDQCFTSMLLPKQPTPPSSDWPMLHFYATTKTANASFLWLTNASLLCYYQNSQRLLPLTDQCFTSMLLPKQPTPPSSDWPMLHFYATTKTANASFLWLTNASLLCYYQNSQRLLPLTDQCFTSMLLPKQPTPPSSDWPMLHFYATTKTANASFLWLTNASLLCYYQNSQRLLPLTDQCFTSMLLPKQPTPPSSDWPMLHFYATTKTANASFLWLTNASLLCYYQNSQRLLPLTDQCFTSMLLPKQPTPPSSDWPMLHFYATTKTANASFLWLTNASLLCYYQNSQRLLPLTDQCFTSMLLPKQPTPPSSDWPMLHFYATTKTANASFLWLTNASLLCYYQNSQRLLPLTDQCFTSMLLPKQPTPPSSDWPMLHFYATTKTANASFLWLTNASLLCYYQNSQRLLPLTDQCFTSMLLPKQPTPPSSDWPMLHFYATTKTANASFLWLTNASLLCYYQNSQRLLPLTDQCFTSMLLPKQPTPPSSDWPMLHFYATTKTANASFLWLTNASLLCYYQNSQRLLPLTDQCFTSMLLPKQPTPPSSDWPMLHFYATTKTANASFLWLTNASLLCYYQNSQRLLPLTDQCFTSMLLPKQPTPPSSDWPMLHFYATTKTANASFLWLTNASLLCYYQNSQRLLPLTDQCFTSMLLPKQPTPPSSDWPMLHFYATTKTANASFLWLTNASLLCYYQNSQRLLPLTDQCFTSMLLPKQPTPPSSDWPMLHFYATTKTANASFLWLTNASLLCYYQNSQRLLPLTDQCFTSMLLPKQPTPSSSDWPMLHFYATTKTANAFFLWLTNASLLCYYQNSQRLLPLTDQCFTSMLLPKQPTPSSSDWPMLHFYATTKTANASFLWLTNASLLCYYQNSQRLLPLTDQCFTSMLLPKQPTPPSSDWPMLHFYATTKAANASFLWLTNASLLCYYQNSQRLLPLTDQCFTSMLLPKQPTPPSSDWPMLHFYATTKTANASFLWLTNASLLCYYQNSQRLLPLTDQCFTSMLLPKQPTPPSSDWPMLHFYATTKTANASFLWLTNASLLCYYQNSQRLLPLTDQCFTSMLLPKQPTPPSSDWPMLHFYATTKTANASFLWLTNASLLCYYQNSQRLLPLTDQCFTSMLLPKQPTPPSSDWPMLHFYATTKTANASFLWLTNASLLCYYQNSQRLLPLTDQCFTSMLLPKQPTPPSSDWPMLHFYATTKTANASFLWLTNASLLCYYQNSQRLLPLTDQCFTSMLLPKQPTPPSSDWPMLHFYATTKTANASFLWLTNASLLCYYQNSQRLLPLTDQCFTSMLLPKQPTPSSSDWPMLHFYATTKTANAFFLWLTNASLLCYYQNSQRLLPLTDQCFTSMLLPKQPTPPSSDWPMLHFYATTKTANAFFLWLTNASLLCYYQNSQRLLPLTDQCFTSMLLPKQPTPPSSDWPMLHFYATTKTANASFLWLTNASLLCYYQNSQRLLTFFFRDQWFFKAWKAFPRRFAKTLPICDFLKFSAFIYLSLQFLHKNERNMAARFNAAFCCTCHKCRRFSAHIFQREKIAIRRVCEVFNIALNLNNTSTSLWIWTTPQHRFESEQHLNIALNLNNTSTSLWIWTTPQHRFESEQHLNIALNLNNTSTSLWIWTTPQHRFESEQHLNIALNLNNTSTSLLNLKQHLNIALNLNNTSTSLWIWTTPQHRFESEQHLNIALNLNNTSTSLWIWTTPQHRFESEQHLNIALNLNNTSTSLWIWTTPQHRFESEQHLNIALNLNNTSTSLWIWTTPQHRFESEQHLNIALNLNNTSTSLWIWTTPQHRFESEQHLNIALNLNNTSTSLWIWTTPQHRFESEQHLNIALNLNNTSTSLWIWTTPQHRFESEQHLNIALNLNNTSTSLWIWTTPQHRFESEQHLNIALNLNNTSTSLWIWTTPQHRFESEQHLNIALNLNNTSTSLWIWTTPQHRFESEQHLNIALNLNNTSTSLWIWTTPQHRFESEQHLNIALNLNNTSTSLWIWTTPQHRFESEQHLNIALNLNNTSTSLWIWTTPQHRFESEQHLNIALNLNNTSTSLWIWTTPQHRFESEQHLNIALNLNNTSTSLWIWTTPQHRFESEQHLNIALNLNNTSTSLWIWTTPQHRFESEQHLNIALNLNNTSTSLWIWTTPQHRFESEQHLNIALNLNNTSTSLWIWTTPQHRFESEQHLNIALNLNNTSTSLWIWTTPQHRFESEQHLNIALNLNNTSTSLWIWTTPQHRFESEQHLNIALNLNNTSTSLWIWTTPQHRFESEQHLNIALNLNNTSTSLWIWTTPQHRFESEQHLNIALNLNNTSTSLWIWTTPQHRFESEQHLNIALNLNNTSTSLWIWTTPQHRFESEQHLNIALNLNNTSTSLWIWNNIALNQQHLNIALNLNNTSTSLWIWTTPQHRFESEQHLNIALNLNNTSTSLWIWTTPQHRFESEQHLNIALHSIQYHCSTFDMSKSEHTWTCLP